MSVTPLDDHNRLLLENAFPPGWKNPAPRRRYDLVSLGGGTAGIIAALGTAGLGGRAALVEERLLGGDCLNFGCVPSKALFRAARRGLRDARHADRLGVRMAAAPEVDFAAVMERMRRLRAGISHHDSAERFASLGVDVFLGKGRFVGPKALEVGGARLEFKRAVIATGGRPAVPTLDGLSVAGFLTNETVFSLERLPPRLIVLGAGPIGCELAQAFRRFGCEVLLVGRQEQLLPKEDSNAAAVLQEQFQREGIQLYLGWNPTKVEQDGDQKVMWVERGGQQQRLAAGEILVAVGREPNVAQLGLDASGVECGPRGVRVDDFLRTSNRRIFAAGDVCGLVQFTHAADAMARICIQNSLFFGRKRFGSLVIPRCTYTDPEVGQVGLTPAEAAARNIAIDTYRVNLAEVDRAILDGETDGFATVYTRRGTGRVVGATVVAPHAGDLLAEVCLLMTRKLPLAALAQTIHAYPTQCEVWKRLADQYQRTRLTPLVSRVMRTVLSWRR